MASVGTTTPFSADEASTIAKSIGSHPLDSSRDYRKSCLEKYYEIEKCQRFILDGAYKMVALQFPDFLLCDSVWVLTRLSQLCPSAALFILGDTSYGSCCVDEVAAEHSSADCIIHFGPSCLTRINRLPVLYVFGCEEIDVGHCSAALHTLVPDRQHPVLVLYDVGYSHAVDELKHAMEDYSSLVVSSVVPPPSPPSLGAGKPASSSTDSQCMHQKGGCGCSKTLPPAHPNSDSNSDRQSKQSEVAAPTSQFGRLFNLDKPIEEYCIFYIGYECLAMSHLIMKYSSCKFYGYDPVTKASRLEGANVNKALGRRYFLIQKAKEAKTIGILVGTLGAANYLDMIDHLKKVIKAAGKKHYTIAMGKLNPAKMANFMEIDSYVLVACPENSLVESREFFKSVVTPFELEVACIKKREWLGQVVSDFNILLPGGSQHLSVENLKDEDMPDVDYSFISGKMISLSVETEDKRFPMSQELVEKREEDMKVGLHSNSSAATYLQSRSWKGLDPQLGKTPVSKVTHGRAGLPIQYDHEPV